MQCACAVLETPMSVTVENESSSRTAYWPAIRRWIAANTFTPAWLTPAWSRHPGLGYLAAILLQVLAALATLVLVRVFPLLEFQAALSLLMIVLVAFSWGAGPGLLAVIVGAAVHAYVIL